MVRLASLFYYFVFSLARYAIHNSGIGFSVKKVSS